MSFHVSSEDIAEVFRISVNEVKSRPHQRDWRYGPSLEPEVIPVSATYRQIVQNGKPVPLDKQVRAVVLPEGQK